MSSSRWLLIPGLMLAVAGCSEELSGTHPPVAANVVSNDARPLPGGLPDVPGPDPSKFQVTTYPGKAKDEKGTEKSSDIGKAAVTRPADAETKPADTKLAAAEKKPDDDKSDAEKKPADSKGDDDKKAAETTDELAAKAREALEKDEVAKAISLFEKVVAINPKHHDALLHLAMINNREASERERPKSSPYYMKAAAWMRQLRAASPKLSENEQRALSMFVYNEACTYAVEGEKQKAIKSLEEACESAMVPIEQLKNDEELESLRKLPEYAALMKKLDEQTAALARKAAEAARKRAKVTLAENKPFKFSFSLPNLDDKKVSLTDFKGKVVIVDVWGTWCPPCRAEIPHFVELYKKYHDKGLEIVGINYENQDDNDEAKKIIKAFVEKNKMPYTCVLGDEDTQKQIPHFEGFPTTLFIDREGKVRAKTVGFDEAMIVELETIVTILLDEGAPKGP